MKLLSLYFALFLCSQLIAQTHIWTGNGANDLWNNTENWNTLSVPDATSNILIPENSTVALSNNGDANTILIEDGANLVIEAAGLLNITTELTLQGSELAILGELQNNGHTVTIEEGATLMVKGEFNSAGGTIVIANGGELAYENGALSGGTFDNSGTVTIFGNHPKNFTDISFINRNATNIIDAGLLRLFEDVMFRNEVEGTIDIRGSASFLRQSGTPQLLNLGRLQKTTNGSIPGNSYMILEVINEGTIDVAEGETFLFLSAQSSLHNTTTGIIKGSGTLDITADFNNQGIIAPGLDGATGTLNITNNFNLNGGTLQLDISSTVDEQFDQINIFGTPTMEGDIEINVLDTIEIGDSFNIINWNLTGSSCTFPSEVFGTDASGLTYTFNVICNQNSVMIVLVETSTLNTPDFTKSVFSIMPNPAKSNSKLFMNMPTAMGKHEHLTIIVYDMRGLEIVQFQELSSGSTSVNLPKMAPGVYIVNLLALNRLKSTQKLVIH